MKQEGEKQERDDHTIFTALHLSSCFTIKDTSLTISRSIIIPMLFVSKFWQYSS